VAGETTQGAVDLADLMLTNLPVPGTGVPEAPSLILLVGVAGLVAVAVRRNRPPRRAHRR